VASPAALEKVARLHGGQKVVFSCRSTAASGETVVWDVKKKANWWKRGIILGVIVLSAWVAAVAVSQPEI
jgi:hypothetical protein